MQSVIVKNAKKIYKLFYNSPKLLAVEDNFDYNEIELSTEKKGKLMKLLGNKQFSIIECAIDARFDKIKKMTCNHQAIPIEIKLRDTQFGIDSEDNAILDEEVYNIFMTVIDIKNDKGKKSKEFKLFQSIEYKLKLHENWHEYLQLYKLILLAKICKINNLQYFDYFIYRFAGYCSEGAFKGKNLSYIGFSQGRKQKRYLEHMNGNTTNSKVVVNNCERYSIKYSIVCDMSQYNFADFNMKKMAQEVEDEYIRLEKKSTYSCVNSNSANKISDYVECKKCGALVKDTSLKAHYTSKKCKNSVSTAKLIKEFSSSFLPAAKKEIETKESSFSHSEKESDSE